MMPLCAGARRPASLPIAARAALGPTDVGSVLPSVQDGEDNRRHLLRIWNLPEGGRPDSAINPGFPTRQGIIRAGAKPSAPLEAEE